MNFSHLKQLYNHKGFTLMEVMVSVSVFTIVVTVGIGSLLTINSSYRKAQTDRKAVDSLTYMLESMSRRIRTARSWTTTTAGDVFEFVDQDGVRITYSPTQDLDGIQMTVNNQGVTNPTIADGSYEITPEGVHTDPQRFIGSGLSFVPFADGQNGQRYVQINLGGEVDNARQTSQFIFQTGISKRSFE